MELSIIIVNFNTKDITQACLNSIKKYAKGVVYEIILVDNGSTDGSIEAFKKYSDVHVIANENNLGFAKANNQGIKIAKGNYILLLNSDTEIQEDSIGTMVRFMDGHPKAGASTCRLLLPSGQMDPACHRGFPTPWASLTYLAGLEKIFPTVGLFAGYHQGYKNMSIPHQVDCISGAFFLVRREATKQVGLLNEDYFMYAEDIDWAYRLKQAGWEIWFNPETSVLHKKKQSGLSHGSVAQRKETERYFHTNNWLFYKKHYQHKYGPIVSFFISMYYRIRLSI